MTETILQIKGPSGPLEGAYLDAGHERHETVLIVPGSGPTDRDGNSTLGISASSYRYLAHELARVGINSLRIDKRGLFGSSKAIPDANDVTLQDYAQDVADWASFLKRRFGNNCIWVVGHSEGGLVALLSAQQSKDLCGVILAATPGRPFADILRQQLADNPANAPLLDDGLATITALEEGNAVDVSSLHPALQQLFNPNVQDYIRDLMSYDPAEMIGRVTKPLLILQGKSDIQVSVDDARKLHAAQPNARLDIVPDVNHVLKEVRSSSWEENLATYANPNLPMHSRVTDAVVSFIKERSR